jgi:PAS domain S-box-containing protein
MDDESKTKKQLVDELAEARRRVPELEASEAQDKWVDEALWESERRFRSIAETASDAIIIFDSHENIFFWNQAAKIIFGYSAGETRGRLLASIMPKRFGEVFRGQVDQMISTGESDLVGKTVEVTGVRKDGKEFPLELSFAPWKTREGLFFTIVGRDITERKQMEEALQESEEHYRSMVESIDLGLNLIDCDYNIVMLNAAQGRNFNKPVHEMVGKKCFREFEERDAVCPHCPGVKAIATGQPAEVEIHRVRDGIGRFMRLRAFPTFGQDGIVRGFVEIGQDITERKRAEEALQVSEERFALAVQGSNDGLWDWDIANDSLYWSPRLKEMLGYVDDELDVDFDTFELHLHPEDAEFTKVALEAHLKDRGPYNVEHQLRTKSGEYRWFHTRGQALWDEAGNPIRMTGHTTDITERKRTEGELAYMATHDALTGLPNRWLLNDRLTLELARAHRHQQKLALMLLDLDRFKDVNDTLGHTAGDKTNSCCYYYSQGSGKMETRSRLPRES